MPVRLLPAADAHWRESNQMRVPNTDLAKQLQDAYPDGPRALPPELGGGRFEPPR